MKRILLMQIIALVATACYAQPQIDENNKQPVKLSDVIRQHREEMQALPDEGEDEDERDAAHIKEGKDYHFDRWLWYWQQHTDQQGYLVSPARTWEEWKKYNRTQSQRKTTAGSQANWKFEGPSTSTSGYSGIGRINAMDFHPTDANALWVGTAGGGIWKTTNGGNTWTSITDNLPILSVSDVDVNPKNPQTIYFCTGDRDGRDHYSIGVLKTLDGGNTWDTTGIKWSASQFRLANTLVINPKDTAVLLLASSEGLYKSFDAGKTWNIVRAGNFKQVLYHPTDTNVVYATSFYVKNVSPDAQIYRSADGGNTWTQVTNLTDSWRITLAVSPADIGKVKAVVATYDPARYRGLLGVFHSSDTGKNFSLIFDGNSCSENILSNNMFGSGCSGQGNYDLAMAISPTDINTVYVGGVNTWYSYDGGFSWQIVNQWYTQLPGVATVHADKHFLAFHPVNQRLYECNDGGIYWTANPTASLWNDISQGLGITQFYRNAVSNLASYVLGGAQDNGTKSLDNGVVDDVTGGDGMNCEMDSYDPNVFYTGVQYGVIYRVDNGFPQTISGNIPGQPTGAWITPYVVSPHNSNDLIAGYQYLYYSSNQGSSWSYLTQTEVEAGKNLLRLAMTPASASTVYAVPDSSGNVYYTHNFTPGSPATFTLLTPPYSGRIADIEVDAKDKDHFWLVYSGFGSPQVVEHAANGSWAQINNNLPDVPLWCIEQDTSYGILYIGTDIGVYYMDTVNKQWEPFNTNLPSVHVTDLGINYTTNEIWAATYGRGMWHSARQKYGVGISIVPYTENALTIYPNPAHRAFTLQSAPMANKNAQVSIRNYEGKTVMTRNGKFDAAGKMPLTVNALASGTYFIEVTAQDNTGARQKLVLY